MIDVYSAGSILVQVALENILPATSLTLIEVMHFSCILAMLMEGLHMNRLILDNGRHAFVCHYNSECCLTSFALCQCGT